jgi:cell division septation protein DedD
VPDLTTDGADDGFHEIQLNGKQLVFLFIVTTLVSVAIFLCGVLVGRGARVARGEEPAQMAAETAPAPPPVADAGPPAAEPPPPATESPDELSYHKRLQGEIAPADTLKPPASAGAPAAGVSSSSPPTPKSTPAAAVSSSPPPAPKSTPAAAASSSPPPAPKSTPAAAAAASPPPVTKAAPAAAAASPPPPSPAQPAARGTEDVPTSGQPGTWVVQVQALRDRAVAVSLVRRLTGQGYPAFLVTPSVDAAPQFYKVHVGRYAERREAEQVKRRLEKEEQFKPWISR